MTEEINAHVEGIHLERGIFRMLPLIFMDRKGRQCLFQCDINAVEVFGATSPYHTAKEGDDFVVYVGSQGNFLEPGDYPYRIT